MKGSETMLMDDLYTGSLVQLTAHGGTKEFNEARARWSNDAEFVRLYGFAPAVPRTLEFFERAEKKPSHEEEFLFGIRTREDNKLIGECGLEPTWNHQFAFLFIGIGEPEYRGKGYGTDAVRLLLGYSFRELGMHRVMLQVFSGNPRAIRSYEKAGFQREAVQRSVIYRDGVRYDNIIMGVLRREWEAGQG